MTPRQPPCIVVTVRTSRLAVVVYLLALAAALLNAVASILQRLGVEGAPGEAGLNTRVLTHMLQRAVWFGGLAVMLLGFAAQATALHLGALAIVQPLLVTELAFVIVSLWFWYAMPFRSRDLWATLALGGGVAAFLALAAPTSGSRHPSTEKWAVVAAVVVGLAGIALVVSRRGRPWWRSLWLGAAASVGFALTAAITKTVSDEITRGWGVLFSSWPLYALVVVGLLSFLLMQQAFAAGPFAASQSSLILVNPFVAMAIGAVLFGDRLRLAPLFVAAEVTSLILMVAGAVALATSPLIVGVHDESPDNALLAGRGRWAKWRVRRADASK